MAKLRVNSSQPLILIHAVTCPLLDSNNSPASDRVPALVGSVATFSCPPGMVLTGPNVTTCMENRQWYPDPTSNNIVCKGEPSKFLKFANLSLILIYYS
jgi:hypothetical protein